MNDGKIIAAIGLIGGIIAIISPIIKLNSNITKLTTIVEQLEKIVNEKTEELANRVTKHGEEIDDIRLKQTDHEVRIKTLENK